MKSSSKTLRPLSGLNLCLAIISMFGAVACGPAADHSSIDTTGNSGIIGGGAIPEGAPEQRSIVGIRNMPGGYICTGSLLPNNIVLTAAHCIGKNARDHVILFSTDIIVDSWPKDKIRTIMRPVSMTSVHPGWHKPQAGKNAWNADLALLKFDGPVPPGFEPATFLPPATSIATDQLRPGVVAMVAGYGVDKDEVKEVPKEDTPEFKSRVQSGDVFCGVDDKTKKEKCYEENASGAGKLKATDLPIVGRRNPNEILLSQDRGTSVCMGDSGGPAYLKAGNKLFLWGVASRVSRGCNGWAIFTDASSQTQWLMDTIRQMLGGGMPPQAGQLPPGQPGPVMPPPNVGPQPPPPTAQPVRPMPLQTALKMEPPKSGQLLPGQQGPVQPNVPQPQMAPPRSGQLLPGQQGPVRR